MDRSRHITTNVACDTSTGSIERNPRTTGNDSRDNGPEFISHQLDIWCKANNISLHFIQPGKPTQNAFVERCNGNIRKEFLECKIYFVLSKNSESKPMSGNGL
ncbi:MAG: transposase family protein [Bacteroidetes bacterium]|nr:transposase family protein [Bacteroidota bacterium]